MRSAKVEKLVKKKKRKRSKVSQWRVDSDDEEWIPSKKKKAMKIVLVKRRPVSSESEDEDVPQKSWRRNHHKWLIREKENMTQNKVLAKLKQKADKQKREDRSRVRNLMIAKNSQERMLKFHKANWVKTQLMTSQ